MNSVVTPQGNTNLITGGTTAGGNLFHSFREFSLPTGNTAYFNNALSIENIITRVTGSSVSNIDGLIRANGSANLFLLNPNGIIFGSNAALNIGGSFLGTTAESIQFSDGSEFSATNPQVPPLLSMNVPIGLQFGTNPGMIRVEGIGHQLSFDPETGATITENRPIGLAVSSGETLALVGGSMSLIGGNLTAPQGRIELGSVASGSLITLGEANPGWQLGYAGVENFQNIRLWGAASVDASGAGAGNIHLQARQLTLSEGSAILALTEGDISGGSITVNTTDSVELIGTAPDGFYTSLLVDVQPKATGNAGNARIETGRLIVRDGGQVGSAAFGAGDAGNLTVETDHLIVRDGGQAGSITFGAGNAGTLSVVATDSVEVIGTSADGELISGLFTSAQSDSTGNGGNLRIETNRLSIRDGGRVNSGTWGTGDGGTLTVVARDLVEVIGISADGEQFSSLLTSAQLDSIGNGGDLRIETGRLSIRDRAQVNSVTKGAGDAGNLTVIATDSVEVIGSGSGLLTSAQLNSRGNGGNLRIETNRLSIRDGGEAGSVTFGVGDAGTLTVVARDLVEVVGISADGKVPSILSTSTESEGNAGNLSIETSRLSIRDGGDVNSDTYGAGDAGNLTVVARDSVEVIGIATDVGTISWLSTLAWFDSTGNAGNLSIETNRLMVRDRGQVSSDTSGAGDAGNLTVMATNSVEVVGSGSGLFTSAQSDSMGNAGNLTIETPRLNIQDRATVSVTSDGVGTAGNLVIDTDAVRLNNFASLRAETLAGDESQGNITLNAADIQLRRGSDISTNAQGTAAGGNITINTDTLAALDNSDITANADNARGGQVLINAQGIFGTAFRESASPSTSDITATSELGASFSGTVSIKTPDIDPSSGLVELATNLIDVNNRISTQCDDLASSSFAFVGRGGLPPTPYEPLQNTNGMLNWAIPMLRRNRNPANFSPNLSQSLPQARSVNRITEAQGWVMSADGRVMLVAASPRVEPRSAWYQLASCSAAQ